jgi:invasion protein IalB
MHARIVNLLAAIAMSPMFFMWPNAIASAEDKAKTRFGAWELHCETPSGATSERCALVQTVRSEDKANANLGVIVARPPELKTTILRVVAPLNVYLLNGVSLKIDQNDIGRASFFRCSAGGCLSDIPIEDKLLSQLKSGKIATLVIYLEPYEGLRHLVRLEGFNEGYERLR